MLIGYIRVKAGDEDTRHAQRRALEDAGCGPLVEDLIAEGRWDQPELRRLLDELRPGDGVVVAQLDALARSLSDLVRILARIGAAGAACRSLQAAIDTTPPAGRAAGQLIGRLAAFERTMAGARIGLGLAAARAAGRGAGRPSKLTLRQRAAIAQEVLAGRRTAASMARLHQVSEATVSRLVAAHRAGALEAASQASADADGRNSIAGVLPLAALDERIAIVGTSGSGKTYAAKGLVERLMDRGGRVCVVDPLGVWWGLRAGADGTAASGYPVVVFGGRHADVALDEGMGAALGRLVGTHPLACVVDVSDLGSSAARRSFMTAFAEALYEANTHPLHLVLDEADLWAPQRAQPGGHALGVRIEEIVRRGRVRGFVPWLITQRPAVLHKDVLSQADILVSMKLTASQDRDAVGGWIEGQADRAEGRRILAELPRLDRGDGYVWAPSDGVLARVPFPVIHSYDSSRTPQRDERVTAPRTLAAVDLSAITAALAEIEGRAADGRADPAGGGRKQVAALERTLRQRDHELAVTRARVAETKAEAAAMQARLDQIERRDPWTTPPSR